MYREIIERIGSERSTGASKLFLILFLMAMAD